MSREWELEQAILLAGAAADVVDDQRNSSVGFLVTDDHDVQQIGRHGAGHEIVGEESGGILFSSGR